MQRAQIPCRFAAANLNSVLFVLSILKFAHAASWRSSTLQQLRARSHEHQRSCTDVELGAYLYRLTYGPSVGARSPAKAPDCVPQRKRKLALNVESKPLAAKRKVREGQATPFFVQMNVVKIGGDWCPPPCQALTWERAAVKPAKDDPNYQLLELTIWYDERRVALYEFDDAWFTVAQDAYWGLCNGTAWDCDAVAMHRESKKLWEAQWAEGLEGAALSGWLRDTLGEAFGIALDRNGQHYGMAYVGHGSRADGSLFEGVVHREDAIQLLQAVTSRRKFALFDFGGNCAEGRWNMLAALQPFAEYVIASDLLVVSAQLRDPERMTEYLKLSQEYDPLSHIAKLLQEQPTPIELAKQLLAGQRKLWEFCEPEIKEQRLKQSRSLFQMHNFSPLQIALTGAWKAASAETRNEAMTKANKAMCDVLAFSEALGETAEFMKLRIDYVSTADMFDWDRKTNGLGFNFLGWKEPPCDVAPALGGSSGTQVCKEPPRAFDAGSGGCQTYKQGGANHEMCSRHWMDDYKAIDVCPECGSCLPGDDIAGTSS